VLAVTTPSAAQQPYIVDDAEVTAANIWHLEISNQVDLLRGNARPARWQNTLEWEVDYGLGHRLEVAWLFPVVSIVSDRPAPSVVGGIGDTSFGLKYRFTSQSDALHSFAGSASLELPTGSRARQLGSGLVDYGLNLISQHRLHRSATLRFNGGLVLAGNTQSGVVGIKERGTVVTAGGSLVGSLSARVQLGGELTMAWSEKAAVGGSYGGWQIGMNVMVRDGMTVDASVLGGWFDVSPRGGFQVGTTFDLNH